MASTSLHFFPAIWAFCLRLVQLIFKSSQKEQLPMVSPDAGSNSSRTPVNEMPAPLNIIIHGPSSHSKCLN
jgi:hypothetical protein